jgi:hypothetical protein
VPARPPRTGEITSCRYRCAGEHAAFHTAPEIAVRPNPAQYRQITPECHFFGGNSCGADPGNLSPPRRFLSGQQTPKLRQSWVAMRHLLGESGYRFVKKSSTKSRTAESYEEDRSLAVHRAVGLASSLLSIERSMHLSFAIGFFPVRFGPQPSNLRVQSTLRLRHGIRPGA